MIDVKGYRSSKEVTRNPLCSSANKQKKIFPVAQQ